MICRIALFVFLCTAVYAQSQETKQSNVFLRQSLEELMDVQTETKADIGSRSGERDTTFSEVPMTLLLPKRSSRAVQPN